MTLWHVALNNMIRAHVIYSGRVQGVGFRYTVLELANQLHVTGWVKNLPDGRVEAVIEGDEDSVKKLALEIDQAFKRNIRDKLLNYSEGINEFQKFEIVY